MANALYNKAREKFLTTGINWLTDDVRAMLVSTTEGDNAYTFSADHEFLDSIHANARRATMADGLTDKSAVDGKAVAENVTYSSVTGAEAGAIVIYKHNADPAAADLIAYIDDGVGLPIVPNGGDIFINWDDYIFQL